MKTFISFLFSYFILTVCLGQFNCSTSYGLSGSIDEYTLDYNRQLDGPYYIKVYTHIVSRNGKRSVSPETVAKAFQRLHDDFSPRGIYFVQACDPFMIDGNIENSCELTDNSDYNYGDGISIFFSPEDDTPAGSARRIPNDAFFIQGMEDVFNGPDVPLAITSAISHEMGHCLGLHHTFNGAIIQYLKDCDGNEIDSSSICCEDIGGGNSLICGDFLADTDADPYFWSYVDFNTGCDAIEYGGTHKSQCIESISNDQETA